MAAGNLAVDPVMQITTIGVLGLRAQWVAWRLHVPAIVLMLGIVSLAGPLLCLLDPKVALGDLDVPVVISDTNHRNLHSARDLGVTRISSEYPLECFQHDRPEAVLIATLHDKPGLKLALNLEKLTSADGMRILHFSLPLTVDSDTQGVPKNTILH